jgi:hypothetical protein
MALHLDAMHLKDVRCISLRHYPERIVPGFYVLHQELVLQTDLEAESTLRMQIFFKARTDLVMYLEALKKIDPSNCEEMT